MSPAPPPWIVIPAEPDPRDTSDLPTPYRPQDGEACDLAEALRGAWQRTVPGRVLPVVREQDRTWWAPHLDRIPATNRIEEPLDRGSGPGVVVAALRIRGWDPAGRILVLQAEPRASWREIFATADRLLRTAVEDDDEIHVADRVALGTVNAWLLHALHRRPELYLQFERRPNAAWDLGSIYPFIDHVDLWEDLVPAPSDAGERLTTV